MARAGNFTAKTKRERLKHANGFCEAVGPLYGLDAGVACNADLGFGVEFDHFDLVANSRDNSFDNCRAVCPACHRFKTSKHDVPRAAKTLRQQDKNNGIRRPKGKLKSAPFPKPEKEKKSRDTLPPRKLYQ
jgi:hypothetical protein